MYNGRFDNRQRTPSRNGWNTNGYRNGDQNSNTNSGNNNFRDWNRSRKQSRYQNNNANYNQNRFNNNRLNNNQHQNRFNNRPNRNHSRSQSNNRNRTSSRNRDNNWSRSRSRNQHSNRNQGWNRNQNGGTRNQTTYGGNRNRSWNNRNRSSSWNKNREERTADRQETTRSSNGDFQSMCRALYKIVQIEHHKDNWTDLPRAIARNLEDLASDIVPPDPTNNLREQIQAVFNNTASEILACVQNHLQERLNFNRAFIRTVNPQDKERAKEIVERRLTQCLGKKIGEVNITTALNREVRNIGINHQSPVTDNGETDDESDEGWTAVEPPRAKKTRKASTPPSPVRKTPAKSRVQKLATGTSRFQILADRIALEELESRSEQPLREMEMEDEDHQEPDAVNHQLRILAEVHAEQSTSQTPVAQQPSATQPTFSAAAQRNTTRKTRHEGKIKADWKVKVNDDTKVLIITDSNFKNLPEEDIPQNWQVEIFPGATFATMANVIKKLPSDKIEHLITSVGINNKAGDFKKTTYREAGRISEACATLTATVHAVGVSFSPNLHQTEQENLKQINQRLRQIFTNRYIQPLKPEETATSADNIHYTTETIKQIWRNITSHVGKQSKNF